MVGEFKATDAVATGAVVGLCVASVFALVTSRRGRFGHSGGRRLLGWAEVGFGFRR